MNILTFPLGIVILEAAGKHKGMKFVIDTTKERNILFANKIKHLGYDIFEDWELFNIPFENGYPLEDGNGMNITDFIIEIKLLFNDGSKKAQKLNFEYSDKYLEYQKLVDEYVETEVHGVLGLPYLAKHQDIIRIGATLCKDGVADILRDWSWKEEEIDKCLKLNQK